MYNKVFNLKDCEYFHSVMLENAWNQFPPTHQWNSGPHVCKVISILEIIKNLPTPQKIIDIGAAAGAFPHLAQKMGHDVTAIDLEGHKYFATLGNNALSKLIIGDIFEEVDNLRDESIDIFVDVCAVTHFNHDSYTNQKYELNQWERLAKAIYNPLKKEGFFIISTDCDPLKEDGEFISPTKIIEFIERQGFLLYGKYDKIYENTDCYTLYEGIKLPVVSLTFQKK